MTEPTFNERVARRIGLGSHDVAQAIERWEGDVVMRAVLTQRIEDKLAMVRTELETCAADKLHTLQGQIAELKACKALILKNND